MANLPAINSRNKHREITSSIISIRNIIYTVIVQYAKFGKMVSLLLPLLLLFLFLLSLR